MGEQMRGLIPAFFDNQEQLDNAQNAIAFCTGHDLTAATDAGVTLDSVVGALRHIQDSIGWRSTQGSDPNKYYCEFCAESNIDARCIPHHDECPVFIARAILAHFPNKGTDK